MAYRTRSLASLFHFVMSTQTLSKIFKSGYSRIPVYGRDTNDIVGLILTKDLIFLDPEVSVSVSVSVCARECVCECACVCACDCVCA